MAHHRACNTLLKAARDVTAGPATSSCEFEATLQRIGNDMLGTQIVRLAVKAVYAPIYRSEPFRGESADMNANQDATPDLTADKQRDEALRRALATPPISNEDILKRSKESHSK